MNHPMMTCARRTFAAGDLAIVERCSCGAVHLTIGAITLRVPASTIEPLAATLGEAARALAFECALRSEPHEQVLS